MHRENKQSAPEKIIMFIYNNLQSERKSDHNVMNITDKNFIDNLITTCKTQCTLMFIYQKVIDTTY